MAPMNATMSIVRLSSSTVTAPYLSASDTNPSEAAASDEVKMLPKTETHEVDPVCELSDPVSCKGVS